MELKVGVKQLDFLKHAYSSPPPPPLRKKNQCKYTIEGSEPRTKMRMQRRNSKCNNNEIGYTDDNENIEGVYQYH